MKTRKSLTLGLVAAAALLSLGAMGPAPAAHAAAQALSRINGTLQPGFTTTAPTTMTVQTPYRGMVTVSIDSSTRIVRRYGGASALDEVSPGDYLTVFGSLTGNNTFSATLVRDNTIQKAFTHFYGSITAVSSDFSQLKVRVLADSRYKSQNPFVPNEVITLNVTPAMTVTLADGSVGTVQNNLSVGLTIASLGVFNRQGQSFTSVSRIRVITPGVGEMTQINGILQPGFSATAPATLTVLTPYHGTVTVGVDANTKFMRRYAGPSSLAELSAGDRLNVYGKYLGGSSYSATTIRDGTIQRAFTLMVGQITAVSGNTITATVVRDDNIRPTRMPFFVGESVTINATSSTTVTLSNGTTGALSSLQTGMRIAVVGVFNRKLHAYISVDRIRVL